MDSNKVWSFVLSLLLIPLVGWAQGLGEKNVEQYGTLQEVEAPFLLSTRWNQSSPFNDDCPPNTAAGCGAIAMAQIMNYYKKPSVGYGQVSYLCANSVTAEANFSEYPFDWDNIRDVYDESNTEEERKAVANLVYLAGAAAKTNYSTSSSATWHKMMWGFQHYLHFSPRSRYHHRRFYSTAEWTEMLCRELEARRPVMYSSSSTTVNSTSLRAHIYVIDGRDNDGNYHCNYGNYGSNRDQFTSLNYINIRNSTPLGYGSSNYQHSQSMATNLYPEDGLTDDDFDYLPVALSSPIVLEVETQSGIIAMRDKVQARFTYSTVFFDNVVRGKLSLGFYLNDELVAHTNEIDLSKDNTTIHHSVNSSFTLPQDLEDGDYEMSIISRANGSTIWYRGWSDAPNIIPVTVRGGFFTFHMPDYHCGETNLCLDGMPQFIDLENQRVIAFTLHNPSTNNFENELKVCFGDKTQTLLTSIYDGQSVTYQFVVDTSTEIEDICLSYYETNKKEWISLLDNGASLDDKSIGSTSRHLSVYSINGQLLKQFSLPVTQQEYDRVLNQLPNGLYILSDQKGVRKYVKRTRNGRNM